MVLSEEITSFGVGNADPPSHTPEKTCHVSVPKVQTIHTSLSEARETELPKISCIILCLSREWGVNETLTSSRISLHSFTTTVTVNFPTEQPRQPPSTHSSVCVALSTRASTSDFPLQSGKNYLWKLTSTQNAKDGIMKKILLLSRITAVL